MKNEDHNLPFITLVGEENENFYQLGLKDRDTYSDTFEHLTRLVSLPGNNRVAKQVFDNVVEEILDRTLVKLPYFRTKCAAYAEGVGRPVNEIARAFLIPELMSSISKWLPTFDPKLLGCSSYFTYDEDTDSPIHGRILDFPLVNSFDVNERAILSKFGNNQAVLSIGSSGLPFHGLTAINEEGVTLGLHQKFTNRFYSNGYPIFELVHRLMQECTNKASAQDFLRKNPTLTTWCFYMSFSDGSILRADVAGDDYHFQSSKAEVGKVLYFNNSLENKSWHEPSFLPSGVDEFNEMRKKIAHKKIKELQKNKNITEEKLLKAMSLPFNQKKTDGHNLKMDPLTCSSIGIYVLNAKEGRLLSVNGEAPKYYRGSYSKIDKAWSESPTNSQKTTVFKKYPEGLFTGYRNMILAQKALDFHDIHKVYHHVQMAEASFKDLPERYVAKFFFLLLQYLHEPAKELQPQILVEVQELVDHLPPLLKDHAILLSARLEWSIYGKTSVTENQFSFSHVKEIFEAEVNLPKIVLKHLLKWTTFPRLDLWDVVHTHFRPGL